MANEYIQVTNENNGSKVSLNMGVFESIIREVVSTSDDVELADKKAIQLRNVNNTLSVKVDVRVHLNSNAITICEYLQESIFNSIYHMTDLKCYDIAVNVVEFIF